MNIFLTRKRFCAACLLLAIGLFAFATDSKAQSISPQLQVFTQINSTSQCQSNVNIDVNFEKFEINYIQIYLLQPYCFGTSLNGGHFPNVDLNNGHPLLTNLTLPNGSYRMLVSLNNNQAVIQDFEIQFIQITPVVIPTQIPFFPTQVSPPVRTQTVPPLDADLISDWDLETMEGLGLCPGHTTTLQVGDRVLPVPKYQRGGIFLRGELGIFSTRTEDHLGRLNTDWRYATIVDGPVCTDEYPNDVSWFKVYMNANNEPISETVFLTGWLPLQNLEGFILLQEAVHQEDHFPWEYFNSLQIIATQGYPDLSNLNYPAGYTFLLPNQSMQNAQGFELNLRSGPCESYRSDDDLINLHDGVFQILRRDVTGDWLEVRLADGRTGWVATRYVNTNLVDPYIRSRLQPNSSEGCLV